MSVAKSLPPRQDEPAVLVQSPEEVVMEVGKAGQDAREGKLKEKGKRSLISQRSLMSLDDKSRNFAVRYNVSTFVLPFSCGLCLT